ncbi:hypothetical protein BV20DRAFT_1112273 [Pilatotrama ljubarskyi]|nr:hypothetical protein BV20DRAFT_1112273 [Pilatotrama ljubarskyi]
MVSSATPPGSLPRLHATLAAQIESGYVAQANCTGNGRMITKGLRQVSARLPLARPRHLVHDGSVLPVHPDPDVPPIPYVAVSYTWDPDPQHTIAWGRPVTIQALDIVQRLARCTPLPLWIDAICIPQHAEGAKQQELPKMADIYRGAVAVWCVVDCVTSNTCDAFQRCAEFVTNGSFQKMVDLGRGAHVFGVGINLWDCEELKKVFLHRWWERAWTFQEATLNPATFLIGNSCDAFPIADALIVARVTHKFASEFLDSKSLSRDLAFWDAVLAMTVAAERSLPLGEAIACVWRRRASLDHDLVYSLLGICRLSSNVTPSYHKPFDAVLCELFRAAAYAGDYSWIPLCTEIDHGVSPIGMGLIPTPAHTVDAPLSIVKGWTNAFGLPAPPRNQLSPLGVAVPVRYAGVVEWQTAPLSLPVTVQYLRQRGRAPAEIWDLLFGMSVGLMAEIATALEDPEIAGPMLDYALLLIDAREQVVNRTYRTSTNLVATKRRLAYLQYATMAQRAWFRRSPGRLVVISCRAGEAVLRAERASSTGAGARVFLLPIEPSGGAARERSIVVVSSQSEPLRVHATALLVRRPAVALDEQWEVRFVV